MVVITEPLVCFLPSKPLKVSAHSSEILGCGFSFEEQSGAKAIICVRKTGDTKEKREKIKKSHL